MSGSLYREIFVNQNTYQIMRHPGKSIAHAMHGIIYTLKNERNFQIECTVAGTVVLLMMWLPLSRVEDSLLIFAITLVLGLELTNTALERVMDILKPRVHPYARVVKDVMAGAVLTVSLGALLIGLLIFLPYFSK